jgi:RNA polymerase sigma-70 factor (ECF subfamily)
VEAELEQKLSTNLLVDTSDWAFQLQKAILKLPEKQRVVFNLRYFEELSYKEIAEITQSKEGALKTNYHLAAKKIETILKTELNLS